MFFSMKIIIDAEAVMYEAYAMMKIAEERQQKSAERATKNMRDERQQLSLQKVRNQNDLDARLAREKNRHIGELVDAKDDSDIQKKVGEEVGPIQTADS